MKLHPLLLLPALFAAAWGAGRWSVRESASVSPLAGPVASSPAGEKPPRARDGDAWDALSRQQPAPENRWRALTLFRQWAETDPATHAKRLASLPEDGCPLWPGRGALETFCKVWAAHDPEGAWQAVQNDPLKSMRDTVAALRAESHAQEIAADESVGGAVRHIAQCKFMLRDPAAASDLGYWNDDSIVCMMLAGGESPFSNWRRVTELPGSSVVPSAIFDRLAFASRETLLALWREGISKSVEEGGSEALEENIVKSLAFTATNADELKALTAGTDSDLWGGVLRTWDERRLQSIVSSPPKKGDGTAALFATGVAELLSRDPAALLPFVQQWAQQSPDENPFTLYASPQATADYAARVRALVEAAPPAWQSSIAASAQQTLGEFEPAFLLDLVARAPSSTASAIPPASDGEDLVLSADSVFDRWVRTDRSAAMAWANSHPGVIDAPAFQNTSREWVSTDPEAASAWINTLPAGNEKDAAIRGLIEVMVTHDPAAASAWAAQLTSGRSDIQDHVMKQWRGWNPNAQPQPAVP